MPQQILDVALLGCAHIPHARSYSRAVNLIENARLVAVYDSADGPRAQLAEEFAVPAYSGPQELIRVHAPDVAILCGPTSEHLAMVDLAAQNGAHVLCEKPIALTVADGQAMIEACRIANVQLHTAFVCRFYPVVQEIKKLIDQGELGTIRSMIGGNRGTPPLPPHYPSWITDASKAGGGALIDHSVHVLDIMRFFSGAEVQTVAAEVDTLFTDITVDDSALLTMNFNNGAIASIDPSWSVRPGNSWSYDFYLRVLGSQGAASIATGREALHVAHQDHAQTLSHVSFEPDIDLMMIENFLQSVRTGAVLSPSATGEDGVRALEVALAAYQACSEHRFIQVPTFND